MGVFASAMPADIVEAIVPKLDTRHGVKASGCVGEITERRGQQAVGGVWKVYW